MALTKRGQDRAERRVARDRAASDKAEGEAAAAAARDQARAAERQHTEEQATTHESSRAAVQEAVATPERAASDKAAAVRPLQESNGPTADHGDGVKVGNDGPANPVASEANNLDAFTAKGLPGTTGDIDTGGGLAGQIADAQGAGQSLLDSVMGADSLKGSLGTHTLGDSPLGDSNAMSTVHSDDGVVAPGRSDQNDEATEYFGHSVTNAEAGQWRDRQATGQDNGSAPGTQEFRDSVAADPTTTPTESESAQASQVQGEDPLETVPAGEDAGTTDTTPAPAADDTVASTGASGDDIGATGRGESGHGVPTNPRLDSLLGQRAPTAEISARDIGGDLATGQQGGDPGDGVPDGTGQRGGGALPTGGAPSSTDGTTDPVDGDGTTDLAGGPRPNYIAPSPSDPLDEIGGAGIGDGLSDVPNDDPGGGPAPDDDDIPD